MYKNWRCHTQNRQIITVIIFTKHQHHHHQDSTVVRNGREALLITPTSKIYLSYCEVKENKATLYLQGFHDTPPCNDLSCDPNTGNPDTRNPDTRNPDICNPDTRDPDTCDLDNRNPDIRDPDTCNPDTRNPDTCDLGIHTNGIETNGTNVMFSRTDTSQSNHIKPLDSDHIIQMTPKPLDSLHNNFNMENNFNGESNNNVIIKPEIIDRNLIEGESIGQLPQDEKRLIEVMNDNSVSLLNNSSVSSISR
jgi:hypothetical protein